MLISCFTLSMAPCAADQSGSVGIITFCQISYVYMTAATWNTVRNLKKEGRVITVPNLALKPDCGDSHIEVIGRYTYCIYTKHIRHVTSDDSGK